MLCSPFRPGRALNRLRSVLSIRLSAQHLPEQQLSRGKSDETVCTIIDEHISPLLYCDLKSGPTKEVNDEIDGCNVRGRVISLADSDFEEEDKGVSKAKTCSEVVRIRTRPVANKESSKRFANVFDRGLTFKEMPVDVPFGLDDTYIQKLSTETLEDLTSESDRNTTGKTKDKSSVSFNLAKNVFVVEEKGSTSFLSPKSRVSSTLYDFLDSDKRCADTDEETYLNAVEGDVEHTDLPTEPLDKPNSDSENQDSNANKDTLLTDSLNDKKELSRFPFFTASVESACHLNALESDFAKSVPLMLNENEVFVIKSDDSECDKKSQGVEKTCMYAESLTDFEDDVFEQVEEDGKVVSDLAEVNSLDVSISGNGFVDGDEHIEECVSEEECVSQEDHASQELCVVHGVPREQYVPRFCNYASTPKIGVSQNYNACDLINGEDGEEDETLEEMYNREMYEVSNVKPVFGVRKSTMLHFTENPYFVPMTDETRIHTRTPKKNSPNKTGLNKSAEKEHVKDTEALIEEDTKAKLVQYFNIRAELKKIQVDSDSEHLPPVVQAIIGLAEEVKPLKQFALREFVKTRQTEYLDSGCIQFGIFYKVMLCLLEDANYGSLVSEDISYLAIKNSDDNSSETFAKVESSYYYYTKQECQWQSGAEGVDVNMH